MSNTRPDAMADHERPDLEGLDDDEAMERLRRLILEPEQRTIREILERLDDRGVRAREVGEVLPAAIRRCDGEGTDLEIAMAPTLEKVTYRAIRRNRKAFAEALFPIMGPAIRRSIAEALKGLVRSFNQALEYSLSRKGLAWRFEALRTGRSFAEIVLLKTLVFRVEQVFLIHRESGLLLQHVAIPEADVQDADMVSGMLTAIRDFVRDGFGVEGGESVQTMEVGDLTVWIEQGPRAVLAAVIRGIAPVEFRTKMREVVEAVHLEAREDLVDFDGDTSVFERVRPVLETCLETKTVEKNGKTGPWVWVAAGLVAVAVGWAAFAGWRSHRALETFLDALSQRPGIVVTTVDRTGRDVVVRGLRDPLADDPERVLEELNLEDSGIHPDFGPYVSLDAAMVDERVRRILRPPDTVSLEFENGVLTASGTAGTAWVERSRRLAPVLPGVVEYRDDGLEVVDETETIRKIQALRSEIEAHVVDFDVSSTELGEEARTVLEPTVESIRELIRLAGETGRSVIIIVVGGADSSGSADLNARLKRRRAEAVAAFLVRRGVPEEQLKTGDDSSGLWENARNGPRGAGTTGSRSVRFFVRLEPRASNGE